MCTKDCILPTGGGSKGQDPILVQPGTEIHIVWWAAQRDPRIWGEDADKFRPERWENSSLALGWAYMPFLMGPRTCPAKQMVLAQASFVLARMMKEFKSIENRDPVYGFVEEHRLTMQSRNGVKVAFLSA